MPPMHPLDLPLPGALRRRALTALALCGLLTAAACGGSSTDGPDAGPAPTTTEPEPTQVVLFADSTPVPTPTVVLVPAEFELPESCEDMAAYAKVQADIITSNSPESQEAVDAKAAFNAVVAEQMLDGCI